MTIRPITKRNQLFLTMFGSILLIMSLLIATFFWRDYKMQMMLIILASMVVLLSGVAKLIQPDVSFILTADRLRFFHKWGQWYTPWQNIIRIDQVQSEIHGQRAQLPYLGIKIKSLAAVAKNISPRLANKLLHEQKELLTLAVKTEQLSLEQSLLHFEPIVIEGETFKGPVAAWVHRCQILNQGFGFHLYLPEDAFDRDLDASLTLLKSYLESKPIS